MNKKLKKLLTIVVTLAIGTTILAGCGSNGASKDSNGKVTVTYWNAFSENENKVFKEKVIAKFEKDNPNIIVKSVQMPTNGLEQQVIQAVAGSSCPDLMRMDITWVAEFANLGALTNVDSLSGFSDIKDTFFPATLKTNYFNGKYYGLPFDTNTKAAIYSKKVLAQVGLTEPPKTYDELLSVAGKLNKDQYLIGCDGASPWSLYPYFLSMGGKLSNDKGTVATGYLNSKESVDALTELVGLYDKKILGPCLLGGKPDKWAGITTDKYLMGDDGPWFYSAQKPEVGANTVLATLPSGSAGSISVIGGEDNVLFKGSKHPKEAWEFAKFLSSEFAQKTMALDADIIPTVKKVANSSELTSNSITKVYVQQLNTAVGRISSPNQSKINDKVSAEWESAFRHKKTPKQALDDACNEIDPLLK